MFILWLWVLPPRYRGVGSVGVTMARRLEAFMRYLLAWVVALGSAGLVFAQEKNATRYTRGPCTEAAARQSNLRLADDAFSYMPPSGKPVSSKAALQVTAEKKFAERTNIKHWCESDQRRGIVPNHES